MGRPSRRGRDIDGILLLDKPIGLSSNDLLQKVKRLFHANKAGHTGALDPLATGMLPICLGEATKFSQHLLDADKRYRVVARLGQRTDTSDAEGAIISERPVDIGQAQLEGALESFRGETPQTPSMYSALKYQGKPLYEYARRGIDVPRPTRLITVYALELIRWDRESVELEIHCSKGTYIRTIVDDLGEMLGCGAHVIVLRRLAVARYPADRMVTLEQLQALAAADPTAPDTLAALDRLLLPMDSAVEDMPEVNLPETIAGFARMGQTVAAADATRAGMVRLTEGRERRFFGIGEITETGYVAPRRLVAETHG
ncbi:tRNA pseudouridine(55) synthase TruB [Acerihabitans arboris]|uniref:tRNA pseudouridine synthase B n=1 Tax=Acerihabitans arboris TaxID=2691583 RepID=A0A845SFI1_9GAMM|nr:tRNA pseudouridine(55) synthase TruB [Acerihabitans arboris]NDL61391.1 tRNA pseudouridine(55) synthase TruB [Acerihabitans arboris]